MHGYKCRTVWILHTQVAFKQLWSPRAIVQLNLLHLLPLLFLVHVYFNERHCSLIYHSCLERLSDGDIWYLFVTMPIFTFSTCTSTSDSFMTYTRITIQSHKHTLNTNLSSVGKHLPRMALAMARTRVKFSLPYISAKTRLLWQEEVVAMQDARREKVV